MVHIDYPMGPEEQAVGRPSVGRRSEKVLPQLTLRRCPGRKELQYCRKYCSIAGSNGSNGSNGSSNGSNGCNGNCGNERKPKRTKEVAVTPTFFLQESSVTIERSALCSFGAKEWLSCSIGSIGSGSNGSNGSNGRNKWQ